MMELTQAQIDQLYLDWSAIGAKTERQRIIKLLEEHIALQVADDIDQDSMDYHYDLCGLCKNFTGLAVAIALIKGEQ